MVQADGAGGDGQAEADTAGGSVARIVHAEEGLEDFGERFGRHAGAVIAHGDAGGVDGSVELDIDAGAGWGLKSLTWDAPDGTPRDAPRDTGFPARAECA